MHDREDGINAGHRNFGRLALAFIPFALGIGVSVWGGMWLGVHDYKHQLDQEHRAAQYVGAATSPTAKIKIKVIPHDCTVVTRVDLDGGQLMMYATNNCKHNLDYMEWHWQGLAPDGTAVASHYENGAGCPIPVVPGDKAECQFKLVDEYYPSKWDERIETVRVWTSANPS